MVRVGQGELGRVGKRYPNQGNAPMTLGMWGDREKREGKKEEEEVLAKS